MSDTYTPDGYVDNGIRDFSPVRTPVVGQKPEYVRFKLAGHLLHAVAEAPAGVLNDLMAGIDLDAGGNRVYKAPNLISFMQGVLRQREPLTPEEADQRGVIDAEPGPDGLVWLPADDVRVFTRLVYSQEHTVHVDELGALCVWLAEKLSNRPTLPSAQPGRGRS